MNMPIPNTHCEICEKKFHNPHTQGEVMRYGYDRLIDDNEVCVPCQEKRYKIWQENNKNEKVK